MFVGAINSTLRKFLASEGRAFAGAKVVVGCSGNFTSEATLTNFANPAEIHSNDVAFYSCMLGRWLIGQPLEYEIADAEFSWLHEWSGTDIERLASIMILLDMLEYEKRNNPHRVRMWDVYRVQFPDLMTGTIKKLNAVNVKVSSFFAGDVLEHFERFGDDPDCIFCCYAPTYTGGYEKMYRRLDEIVRWDKPTYPMLDDVRRGQLLDWMSKRRFLWYDDRLIEGRTPVLMQRRGHKRTVYLYSNVLKSPTLFADIPTDELPNLPYAPASLEIAPDSVIDVRRIKTSELSRIKDAYLGKGIEHASADWAFVIYVDGWAIGFVEFSCGYSGVTPRDTLYLQADFPVSGTKYKRLSKLVIMLAMSGQARKMMERVKQHRLRAICTTAFTDRPVSMKYRGVLKLIKRGETEDGKKFLNYRREFNDKTWAEVLREWLKKHGSKR